MLPAGLKSKLKVLPKASTTSESEERSEGKIGWRLIYVLLQNGKAVEAKQAAIDSARREELYALYGI